MQPQQKLLLVDDDQDLLDLYQQILAQLPSRPEIRTAVNGARAMAMMEAEPFDLLICDLRMPKMDGLQVLSIVRRKYPQLRTVVLTSVPDEEFRSHAYAIGVDLYWQKPANDREIRMFLECLESLLGRGTQLGFHGMQNKSLVDIIQLECLSQNSLVLRVTHGPLIGMIWIQNGEVTDATAADLSGEVAFKGILSWKSGSFETLPADLEHPRTIFKSYNGLLLETIQALDESEWQKNQPAEGESHLSVPAEPSEVLPLVMLSRLDGAEFAMAVDTAANGPFEARGLENPKLAADWARQTMHQFGELADPLRVGQLQQIECLGPQRHTGLVPHGETILCMGWRHYLSPEEVRERTRKALIQWAS